MIDTIKYVPAFVKDADAVFKRLWDELAWERRGKTPRREYYCNEVNVPYVYGIEAFAREYKPATWHPDILAIKEALEAYLNTKFEVCFLNGYENSKDHLGWHADDSPEMDDGRPIAIVTLGAERDIWFTLQGDVKDPSKKTVLKLQHGSLCVMAPGMQDTHFHRIPKADREVGPRISLTFRGYVEVGK